MRGHGLARPHRADFFGGVVADGEDEIETGSARLGELVPALAAQARAWEDAQTPVGLSASGRTRPAGWLPAL